MHGRSLACAQCRRRHVRCDKQEPQCGQCIKYGVDCPGIGRTTDVEFINYAPTKKRRQSRRELVLPSRESYTSDSADEDLYMGNAASSSASSDIARHVVRKQRLGAVAARGNYHRTAALSMAPQINQKLEMTAVAHGFAKISRLGGEYINLIRMEEPLLAVYYVHAPEDRAIRYAIEADALLKLAESQRSPAIRQRGVSLYGKALATVKRQVVDQPRGSFDLNELCLAVYMMSKCEARIGDVSSQIHHIAGFIMLMTQRNPKELEDPAFHELFYCMTGQMLLHCIRKAISMPRFANGEPWMNDRLLSLDPLDSLLRIASGIADLRCASRLAFEAGEPSLETRWQIITSARAIDAAMQDWEEKLPVEWKVRIKTRQTDWLAFNTPYRRKSWPHYYFTYSSEHIADSMSIFGGCLMLVQAVMCKASNVSTGPLDPELAAINVETQLLIRDLADDACANVGTFIDGDNVTSQPNLLFCTLGFFSTVENVPAAQKQWIHLTVDYMTKLFGRDNGSNLTSTRPSMITGKTVHAVDEYHVLRRFKCHFISKRGSWQHC